MPEIDLDAFVSLALRLADAAGAEIRPYFRKPITVEDKADLTPVTVADRAAEAAMRTLIERHFPKHGILGEEFGPAARGCRVRLGSGPDRRHEVLY